MENRTIGKLVSIQNGRISAELNSNLGEYVNTPDGISFVGEVGSYVVIHDYDRDIIAEITGINEQLKNGYQKFEKPNSVKEVTLDLLGEIKNQEFTFGVTRLPRLFMEINLISAKELDIILNVTDSEPVVEDLIDNDTYVKALSIGKSSVFDNYDVKVNLNNFFGYHFALFGNTGAGKSNTLARIIQTIFEKKARSASGAHIIMIDSNGEYDKAFGGIESNNDDIEYENIVVGTNSQDIKSFKIPIWALSADDWAILLNASEKTQIPVIRRAMQFVTALHSNDKELVNDLKNHILASAIMGVVTNSDSSPSSSDKIKSLIIKCKTDDINADKTFSGNFRTDKDKEYKYQTINLIQLVSTNFGSLVDTNKIIEFFTPFILGPELFEKINKIESSVYDIFDFVKAMDLAVIYEGSVSSQRVQEYTSTMVARLHSLQESSMGTIFDKTEFTSTSEFIENFIQNNQLINIDVSGIEDSTAEVLIRVLAKMILDYQRQKKRNNSEKEQIFPINLIIEEAHRFITEKNSNNGLGFDIFERIAKEGRKFRLLLGISSQRPSELSKTVVSQCSNFIIHRVQNPDDLTYISRMIPYVSSGIIERLTYLKTGTALVFGTSINIPTLTEFGVANPKTDSDSANISAEWYELNDKTTKNS